MVMTMDYEKAYKNALERAKKQLEGANVFDYKEEQIAHDIRTVTYAIFPELKESEDERIRDEICIYIGAKQDIPLDIHNRWITWLEKQAPKSQGKVLENSYITPNKEFFQFIYDRLRYVHKENPNTDYMLSLKERISNMYYLEQSKSTFKASDWYVSKVDGKIHDMTYTPKNKDEQVNWTEEDDHHWMMCLECVEECATQKREDFSKTIDWLKSIKQMLEGK